MWQKRPVLIRQKSTHFTLRLGSCCNRVILSMLFKQLRLEVRGEIFRTVLCCIVY